MCCLRPRGAVAQLGERLVRNEEASGSIPLSSTIFFNEINGLEDGGGFKFGAEKVIKTYKVIPHQV